MKERKQKMKRDAVIAAARACLVYQPLEELHLIDAKYVKKFRAWLVEFDYGPGTALDPSYGVWVNDETGVAKQAEGL